MAHVYTFLQRNSLSDIPNHFQSHKVSIANDFEKSSQTKHKAIKPNHLTTNHQLSVSPPGLVPKRASQVATHGAEAGGQIGQVRRCRRSRSRSRRPRFRQPQRARIIRQQCRQSRWPHESRLRFRRTPQSSLAGLARLRVIGVVLDENEDDADGPRVSLLCAMRQATHYCRVVGN